jgi:RNase H-like domain found in reverse transcriptase
MYPHVREIPNWRKTLRDLTNTDFKFVVWNKAGSNSFTNLKEEITKENMPAYLNEKIRPEIFCDASSLCLGANLLQIQPDGESKVMQ